jgi:hypothetical protein
VFGRQSDKETEQSLNTLNAELNPICHLLALLGAHHILHISRTRVKCQTRRITKERCLRSCLTMPYFIYLLFNCEFSESHHITRKDRMINSWRIRRDVEGRGPAQIQSIILENFLDRLSKNIENSKDSLFLPRFDPWALSIYARNFAVWRCFPSKYFEKCWHESSEEVKVCIANSFYLGVKGKCG